MQLLMNESQCFVWASRLAQTSVSLGAGLPFFWPMTDEGKCFVNLFENSQYFLKYCLLQTLLDLKQYSVQLWFIKKKKKKKKSKGTCRQKKKKRGFSLFHLSLAGLLSSCRQDILSWEYSGWWEEEQRVPGRDFPKFEGASWVFT